jgi:hypothetical protein
VRFTLTARTTSEVQGFHTGAVGGVEDRPRVVTNDGFLRRSLTTEVFLRNTR